MNLFSLLDHRRRTIQWINQLLHREFGLVTYTCKLTFPSLHVLWFILDFSNTMYTYESCSHLLTYFLSGFICVFDVVTWERPRCTDAVSDMYIIFPSAATTNINPSSVCKHYKFTRELLAMLQQKGLRTQQIQHSWFSVKQLLNTFVG